MSYQWLDRTVAPAAPFVTLVRNEEDFHAAMAHCNVITTDRWVNGGNGAATCHFLDNQKDGDIAVIVALNEGDQSPIQIAALLVHEAVHVVQHYFEHIAERHPACEQMAYAVQYMSQTLMEEYYRQITEEHEETYQLFLKEAGL